MLITLSFWKNGKVLEEGGYNKLISNPKSKFLQLLRQQEVEYLTEASKNDCIKQTLELISDAVTKSPENTLYKTLQNNIISMADFITKEKKKAEDTKSTTVNPTKSDPVSKPTISGSKFLKAAMQVMQSNKPSLRASRDAFK